MCYNSNRSTQTYVRLNNLTAFWPQPWNVFISGTAVNPTHPPPQGDNDLMNHPQHTDRPVKRARSKSRLSGSLQKKVCLIKWSHSILTSTLECFHFGHHSEAYSSRWQWPYEPSSSLSNSPHKSSSGSSRQRRTTTTTRRYVWLNNLTAFWPQLWNVFISGIIYAPRPQCMLFAWFSVQFPFCFWCATIPIDAYNFRSGGPVSPGPRAHSKKSMLFPWFSVQ